MAMSNLSFLLQYKYELDADVRKSLYADCKIWTRAVEKRGGKFHGGERPDLADLVRAPERKCTFAQLIKRHISKNNVINKRYLERGNKIFLEHLISKNHFGPPKQN